MVIELQLKRLFWVRVVLAIFPHIIVRVRIEDLVGIRVYRLESPTSIKKKKIIPDQSINN